jgi:hypothetical protein
MRLATYTTLFSLMICATVKAEVSVEAYQNATAAGGRATELMQAYVSGVGRGYWLMNYSSQLFCPPEAFIAQGGNFSAWIDDMIRSGVAKPDTKIEVVLLIRLLEVFPCKK